MKKRFNYKRGLIVLLIVMIASFTNSTTQAGDEVPDISGTWLSGDGRILEITQVGTMFEWLDKSNNQRGLGVIKDDTLDVTWQDDYGTHTSTWKIASFDSEGKPTSIVWPNGRSFVKTKEVQAEPPSEGKQPKKEEKLKVSSEKPPDLTGEWISDRGVTIQISWDGDKFSWVDSNNVGGTITVNGKNVTVRTGSQTWLGEITRSDPTGKPTKIIMDNQVILERAGAAQILAKSEKKAEQPKKQTTTKTQPEVPQKKLYDISGAWESNINVKYNVIQNGDRFEWLDTNTNRVGSGTINGEKLTTTWVDPKQTYSAKGIITEFDKDGRPTRVVWDVGIVWHRQLDEHQQQTSQTVYDISGQWDSNVGLKYQVTQNGAQFKWVDTNKIKGAGTINGKNLTTTWKDLLGSHTATGVLEFDAAGKPIKIVWSNGVIFLRTSVQQPTAKQIQPADNIAGDWLKSIRTTMISIQNNYLFFRNICLEVRYA